MWKAVCCLMSVCGVLSACAHRGAVRVECDGPLRPINASSIKPDPVSVAPVPAAPGPNHEKQP